MAAVALAAVRPLLGLISHEAQLLYGVRRDVFFIKDEMESMKGFLLRLAVSEEGASDHQVRAWVAQVMELAYDSKNCIEDYARCGRAHPIDRGKGFLGRLRRVSRLPWVILVRRPLRRRRVAVRIKKLKVRAREIGERQQRYAVAVPTKKDGADAVNSKKPAPAGQERRAPAVSEDVLNRTPDFLTEGTEELIRWLKEKPGQEERQWPRVIAVVSQDGANEDTLLQKVYKRSSDEKLFDLMASITIQRPAVLTMVLLEMARQLLPEDHINDAGGSANNGGSSLLSLPRLVWPRWTRTPVVDIPPLLENLQPSVRGKKLLVVVAGLVYPEEWNTIKRALEKFQCSAGSAVVFSTKVSEVAANCSPSKTKIYSLVDFHLKKALLLAPTASAYSAGDSSCRPDIMKKILQRCNPDAYCMNLFLRALFCNPNRTEQELQSLSESLDPQSCTTQLQRQNRMTTFCYQGLPDMYKNCLWYTTVFTRGSYQVRRASLVRRWVAEGLIARMDEAERCSDALITQKLLLPLQVRGTGKIKTCTVNPLVIGMIKETTADEDFIDTNQLPPDLALHFSIRNGIQLRQANGLTDGSTKRRGNSMGDSKIEQQKQSMMKFLKTLPTSSSFRLLRVLDLEGYTGFKKNHLKNICKIHQLKYLCLRSSDITQLPEEMDQLLHLETLDIRQTRVHVLNVVLPMLKHLLAGSANAADATVKAVEAFSTVRMPPDVTSMELMEMLSYVKVYDGAKELINIGDKLQKLTKLGVVLCGKKAKLADLFLQIKKFNICFRSLSIRMKPPLDWDTIDATSLTLPGHLESLNICGIRGWSPRRIKMLHQLAKITLRDTLMKEDDLRILGELGGLSCLRLRYHSFAEGTLTLNFKNGQFSKLMDLVIEGCHVRTIAFDAGTAPRLSKVVWSFSHMESLLGIQNLPSLTHLDLNRGRCDPDGLEELRGNVAAHRNRIIFSLNPPENGQDSPQPGPAS